MDALTIIVADDHPLFRNALRQAIEPAFPAATIIEAGTLDEAVAALEEIADPDLVLFDLAMPGARGFSGLMYLRAQYPSAPICVVSASDDAATIRKVFALGVAGFVSKSESTGAIRAAVRMILAGESRAPGDFTPSYLADEDAQLAGRLKSLTPQQVRVLMMLGEGMLNKQIAYVLGVSEATVKAHVSAILQKLGVENRTKAVLAAGRFETGQWQAAPAE